MSNLKIIENIGDIVYGRAYLLRRDEHVRDEVVIPWKRFDDCVVCVSANGPYFMGLPDYCVVSFNSKEKLFDFDYTLNLVGNKVCRECWEENTQETIELMNTLFETMMNTDNVQAEEENVTETNTPN